VLTECFENVDYISLHTYWDNWDNDTQNFLAKSVLLDRYIHTVGGIIDYVKAKKRSKHDVYISFDEWNVWYHSRKLGVSDGEGVNWRKAPPILEDVYNFEDVLLVGCALNTFIRRADRVKIAAIAQLVNVIAPIMTEAGGRAWKQTTYYPLQFASLYGRGDALNVAVDVPTYDAKVANDVPYLDLAAVLDPSGKSIAIFVVNRHPSEKMQLGIDLAGFPAAKLTEHIIIHHTDLRATNTAARPDNVKPRPQKGTLVEDGKLKTRLLPHSYNLIRVAV
jgi:alpha-N-arabinofuranosidase